MIQVSVTVDELDTLRGLIRSYMRARVHAGDWQEYVGLNALYDKLAVPNKRFGSVESPADTPFAQSPA